MLHEILLALSGHRSPLLSGSNGGGGGSSSGSGNDGSAAKASQDSGLVVLTPPERQLLQTAEHLSDLHRRLASRTAQISAAHKSAICRAVSSAISSIHLAALQRKILAVEESILQGDPSFVGAYNIVPLTAIVGEFAGWTRRLEWLWELTGFIIREQDGEPCHAARLIDHLRAELQTGYPDIEETALTLVQVAESAWLRQLSAWVFYGRIPTSGRHDFFIERDDEDEQGYSMRSRLQPSFVTPSTASSILFIGVSLDRLRSRKASDWGTTQVDSLSSEIQQLTRLTFPLKSVALARAVTSIRMTLSRTTLQKLLPMSKVFELLQLLRDFFLLGRGEFAMALTQQADEKIRNRWKRNNGLAAYDKRDGLGTVTVKEGEVSATLARTMAFVGTMQGEHAEEDEGLEFARDLLRLTLIKSKPSAPAKSASDASDHICNSIVQTPFRNLLFSVPTVLTMQIPEPLDLFLSEADLQVYTMINSYLLSVRRAHLRLTDLWKITSLRRHHPAPPRAPRCCTKGGAAHTRVLRNRWATRSSIMRSPWTTCSAAIFFLAETEAYLQVEVVAGLWEDFHKWLRTDDSELYSNQRNRRPSLSRAQQPGKERQAQVERGNSNTPLREEENSSIGGRGDLFSQQQQEHQNQHRQQQKHSRHDPQSLAIAHRRYLKTLVRRLLLTRSSFTDPLYEFLIQLDHLVALIHRLHGIWASMDLEEDEGVVDAFSNLAAEERDVRASLRDIERKVKAGVERAVGALRGLSMDSSFLAEMEDEDDSGGSASNKDDNGIGGGRGADDAIMDITVVDEDHAANIASAMGNDDNRDDNSPASGGGGADNGGVPLLHDDVQHQHQQQEYRAKRIGGIDRLLMKLDFGVWFTSSSSAARARDGYDDDL